MTTSTFSNGPTPSESDSSEPKVTSQERLTEILGKLDPKGMKLFQWTRERERRFDWKEYRKGTGRPSPKQIIVDYVKSELLPEGGKA